MALFDECMQKCAQKVLDLADIVRDGDFSPTDSVLAASWPERLAELELNPQLLKFRPYDMTARGLHDVL